MRKIFHLEIKSENSHKYYGSLSALCSENPNLGISKYTLDRFDFSEKFENTICIIRKSVMKTTGSVGEKKIKNTKPYTASVFANLKISDMKTYKVTYYGNSYKLRNFEEIVNAESERQAVEQAYANKMDYNYFPQEDGTILDCDGDLIAIKDGTIIEYDGGYFSAEEVI